MSSPLAGLDRKYAEQLISTFFGQPPEYFKLPGIDDEAAVSGRQEPEFRTLARQWVSTNFGTGKKSDSGQIVKALKELGNVDVASLAGEPKHDVLSRLTEVLTGSPGDGTESAFRSAIGWTTGRASKGRLAVQNLPDPPTLDDLQTLRQKFQEEASDKESKAGSRNVPGWMSSLQAKIEQGVGMPFVNQRNLIGEFSVMLDHAARRVSIAHSWIKRAEAERQRFSQDASRLEQVPKDAKRWLDDFCNARSGITGAATAYRIRRRAIEAWDRVVQRWSRTDCTSNRAPHCRSP